MQKNFQKYQKKKKNVDPRSRCKNYSLEIITSLFSVSVLQIEVAIRLQAFCQKTDQSIVKKAR